MRFTKTEQMKIFLMIIIGIIFERSDIYTKHTVPSAIGSGLAIPVLCIGIGVSIHLVAKSLRKSNDSALRDGIKYGFILSLFVLIFSSYSFIQNTTP
jgi:hypothetical protein